MLGIAPIVSNSVGAEAAVKVHTIEMLVQKLVTMLSTLWCPVTAGGGELVCGEGKIGERGNQVCWEVHLQRTYWVVIDATVPLMVLFSLGSTWICSIQRAGSK